MYFLFSGEGATDLGVCDGTSNSCEGKAFLYGPLTIVTAQIVEAAHGYNFLEGHSFGYVSKQALSERAKTIKQIRLAGKEHARETAYFYKNARALAQIALARQKEKKDDVVALLFRDTDGTASAGRGQYEARKQSMVNGFEVEGFASGVAVLPKPKSEAWWICALKKNPYRDCRQLEDRSGNDDSPKSLKKELKILLGEPASRELLNQKVEDHDVDFDRIDMPSYNEFRKRLEDVLGAR
ncbi:MAG: hypothetical protein WD065_14230 [Planctomycetaceae bacterium]